MARTIDILKKVAPDLPEGKTCEKEDLCREVVKKLGKIEKKWAVALTSEQCNLLDDCEKSQLRDWSKSIGGGGGPEHLEMWLIKTHDPPPPFGTKMTDPPLKQDWKLHDPPPG